MQTQTVYTLLYSGAQHSEISGEFTFPDYLPDIRKVLRVTAVPHVTGKYMNGERLELEGEVSMTLLYVSEENTVCAFTAALPFSQSIAVSGLDETTIVTARMTADSPACRLIGPRKCVLRTRPTLHVRAVAAKEITPDTSALPASDAAQLCTHTEPLKAADLICISREEMRYAEDIAISDGAIVSILSCEVIPAVRECRASAGHVICKGEFELSALCTVQTEGGTDFRSLCRRVPFSETLEDSAITEDCRCEPDITVISVTPTVTEEGRNLGIDFCCEAAVICAVDTEVPVITDAFLPGCDIRILGDAHTVFRPIKTVNGAFSVSGTLKYDPKEPMQSVTDCRLTPFLDRWEVRDGRVVLDGTLEVSLICATDAGSYLPLTASVPLHWDTDATGLPDPANLLLHTDCRVTGNTARMDTGNASVICDAELAVSVSMAAKELHTLPRALFVPTDSKTYTAPKEPLILCYPDAEESVWDIAKRYRIPPQTVREANRLDPTADTVSGTAPLIIPIHPLFSRMKA
ncbi:MAG: DUF3794 domain-containing protein [Ruminococcaceae bacterium]|nr:DUF3794 domain-containing protein [Oscillospiraceae bacterium]